MSEASRAIEASGLVKTYPGGVRALDGLSFEVEAGTVFGMLGRGLPARVRDRLRVARDPGVPGLPALGLRFVWGRAPWSAPTNCYHSRCFVRPNTELSRM